MNLEKKLELFYKMLFIREVELTIADRYSEQQMRCPVHLSIGQEGAAVAIAAHLNITDYMVSSHRGHAHYLAKGGTLAGLIGELYGKVTGCSRGQGGSMHLVDHAAGFVASTSIVGGTIPIGVGTAFGAHLKREKTVSVVCIGDAALEEGVFHESANFAALHELPVIFYCENNMYSCYTHLNARQPQRPLTAIGAGHGLKTIVLNGQDLFESFQSLAAVVSDCREGAGPYFVESKTYRYLEHCGPNNDDNLNYRPPEEIAHFRQHDPVLIAKSYLLDEGVKPEDLDREQQKIKSVITDAFEAAIRAPFPDISELGAYIYGT